MSAFVPLAAITETARVLRTDGATAEVESDGGVTSVCLRPTLAAGGHVDPGDWVLTALGMAIAVLEPDDHRVFVDDRCDP